MRRGARRVLSLLTRRPPFAVALFTFLGAAGGLAWWALQSPPSEREQPTVSLEPGPVERASPPPRRRASAPRPEPRRDFRPPASPAVPADPPRLEIPAIGVRAHAIGLGKQANGELDVPKNWSVVGWWRGGSKPGQRGVAVVVGHVDSKSGPAVFHRLRELNRGDEVRFVHRSGSTARFVVQNKERFSKDRFPTERVYAETPDPVLRLVTCGGSFDWSTGHYRQNLIVYARQA